LRIFLAVLMIFCLVSTLAFGIPVKAEQTSNAVSERISVTVDKRMELLTAVQLFTNWRDVGLVTTSPEYKRDMWSFFLPYVNHTAVTLCEKLRQAGFSYDAPVTLILHLSEPPELNIVTPFSDYLINRAGSEEVLEEFAEALRSFYKESNFEEFWNAHRDYYENLVNTPLSLEKTVETVENYFGVDYILDYYGVKEVEVGEVQSRYHRMRFDGDPSRSRLRSPP